MYGYIYKRENLINHKIYVGQHKHISESVELDYDYKGSGKIFKLALKKYGEDNFTYEILDYANCEQELDEKEIYWIKELDCRYPKGYNISKGGRGFNLDKKQLVENATKGNKSRNSQKWHQPESQKIKMKQRWQEGRFDFVHTQEFKDKCSKAKKGVKYGESKFKGCFWITDGEVNIRLFKGDTYDETKYHLGFTKSKKALDKVKEKYKNGTYVHKGSIDKFIDDSQIDTYLSQGWELGRNKDRYKEVGKKVSKSKKGTIKVVNDEGKIKYIQPDKLSEYEKLGFKRPIKN